MLTELAVRSQTRARRDPSGVLGGGDNWTPIANSTTAPFARIIGAIETSFTGVLDARAPRPSGSVGGAARHG